MRVLNLYAGIGGNRKLWGDEHLVTAVEKNEQIAEVYKSLYPNDTVIIADAHEFLLTNHQFYDGVWSSPPCQTHSKMVKATRHVNKRYPDMSLYQEIIFLTHFFKGKWVVENVKPYYEPLIKPTANLGRHIFWSNFTIPPFDIKTPKGFANLTNLQGKKIMMDWLGIYFEKNIYYDGNHCPVQVLRNAVHPTLGKHVFESQFTGLFDHANNQSQSNNNL